MNEIVPAEKNSPDAQHLLAGVQEPKAPRYHMPEIPWVIGNNPDSPQSRQWRAMQKRRLAAWERTVHQYLHDTQNFYWSYWVLNNHPVFYTFQDGVLHERSLIAGDGVRTGLRFEVTEVKLNDYGMEYTACAVRTMIHVTGWPPFSNTGRMYNLDTVTGGLDHAVIEAAGIVIDRFGFDRRQLDFALRALRSRTEDA